MMDGKTVRNTYSDIQIVHLVSFTLEIDAITFRCRHSGGAVG
jgi:hypothetical protein